MEKCNGVWWYLKVEGKYRHHPSRGRKYMLDDAASRKSGNDDALRRRVHISPPHVFVGEIGPAQKSREKDASRDPGTVKLDNQEKERRSNGETLFTYSTFGVNMRCAI